RNAELFFLISISPGEQQENTAENETQSYNLSPEELDHIKVLEQELQFAKEHLQLTIEELETTNEELQSTNEELIASNEELQSTNEELHSVNEELYTVNSEYQLKINELTKLNNDIKNLHRSSKVRILFLDRHLRIRDFTPEMASTFNLLPQDVGRPVEHLLYNINIGKEELSAYAKNVFDQGEAMVKEIETGANELFLMHVLPYQLETGTIEGIVLYMTDISKLKIMEEEMRKNQKRFMSLLNHIRRPIIYHDSDGNIIHVNAVMAGLVERDFSDLIGENLKSLIVNGSDLDRYLEAANQDQPTPRITLHMQKTDGSKVDVTLDSRPIFDVVGNLIEYQGIGSVSA
ncbi:MAG: PAS domain-containing protein, partial [Chloroflexota bacterium]